MKYKRIQLFSEAFLTSKQAGVHEGKSSEIIIFVYKKKNLNFLMCLSLVTSQVLLSLFLF